MTCYPDPDRRSDLMDDDPERGLYPAAAISLTRGKRMVADDYSAAKARLVPANRVQLHCDLDEDAPHRSQYTDPILTELGQPSWDEQRRRLSGGASATMDHQTVVGSEASRGRMIRKVSVAEEGPKGPNRRQNGLDERMPVENVVTRRLRRRPVVSGKVCQTCV